MIQSYPWYIADWRESETRLGLNLAERGLYRELLDYCYLEGSLPSDLGQLGLLCCCTVADFRKAWPAVEPLFERDGARLIHRKVNEVRLKLDSYHEQKRHAGAKSGQARRERSLNGRSNVTRTKAEPSPAPAPAPAPEPAPTPALSAPKSAALVPVRANRFAEFIAPWPRVANPDHAARAYLSCIDTNADEGLAFAARDRYLSSDEVNRGIVMDPAKWLMDQKSAKWGGKWPAANTRAPNGKVSSGDKVKAMWAERISRGESPI